MDKNQQESEAPRPINWILVTTLVFGPALLALVGALTKLDGLATGGPLIGGAIGGIICGVLWGRRIGKSSGGKVAVGILFGLIFTVLTLGLGFFGCMLGYYELNLH